MISRLSLTVKQH